MRDLRPSADPDVRARLGQNSCPSGPKRLRRFDAFLSTRSLLEKGWPLCSELGPWRGRQLAFLLRWHAASLTALEARHYDALSGPPPAGLLRIVACGAVSLATPSAPRFSA